MLNNNLTYSIQNTVTKNPNLYPDKWYLELDESSKKKVNMSVTDYISINIDEDAIEEGV